MIKNVMLTKLYTDLPSIASELIDVVKLQTIVFFVAKTIQTFLRCLKIVPI